jgi:hypothetical protein
MITVFFAAYAIALVALFRSFKKVLDGYFLKTEVKASLGFESDCPISD